MEDLFKRMLNPNTKERINFLQIRQHPVFAKKFPEIAPTSKIYENPFSDSKIMRNKSYEKANEIIEIQLQKIKLLESLKEHLEEINLLSKDLKSALKYNLTKYELILLSNFLKQLNPSVL